MEKLVKTMRKRIYDAINRLFYNCHDAGGIVIRKVGNSFRVAFTEEHDNGFVYDVEITPEAVAVFLGELEVLAERLWCHYQKIEDELYEGKGSHMNVKNYSFYYKLEEEEYEEDGTGNYGLVSTINDAYVSLVEPSELLSYLAQYKNILENMIGKKVIVLEGMDSEYRVLVEFDKHAGNIIEV
ncbi:hypothetical protein [Massilia sp. WG5]|uniref:hypothetical protein n=1 Tax=Massilia sp. WG5 TaxID=1707785 RepID=UPI000D68A4AF|nr:hypothetical protein [Massilia sp. WG5]